MLSELLLGSRRDGSEMRHRKSGSDRDPLDDLKIWGREEGSGSQVSLGLSFPANQIIDSQIYPENARL